LICKACESKADFAFSGTLLETHVAKYFRCGNCGFLFTEDPVWLGSAGAKSVSQFDTGILQRNLLLTKIVTVLTKFFFDQKGRFLDYGGGYGVFTRLMRDNGLDFYWHDPFSVNLFARGFEYLAARGDKFERRHRGFRTPARSEGPDGLLFCEFIDGFPLFHDIAVRAVPSKTR
jgi:hypothetical protein